MSQLAFHSNGLKLLLKSESVAENEVVTDRYTIHLGDCLNYMRSLATDSVDMVFADPPFNLNKNYATYKDNLPLHQYLDWTYQWLEEAIRVLKPSGSLFVYNIPKLLTFTAAKLNELAIFAIGLPGILVGGHWGKPYNRRTTAFCFIPNPRT